MKKQNFKIMENSKFYSSNHVENPSQNWEFFFMTSYEAQNWDPLYDFENESVLKKSNSSNLFFYISKKNFNILRQSARTIGAARQK